MRVQVVDHPLVAHKVSVLRDKNTPSSIFRQLTDELVTLLAYEATREVKTENVEVQTPVATTIGTSIAKPTPLVVPILRAGLGMLEGMTRLVPTAEVGFLGMARNEETLDIITYADRVPNDLTGRQVFVLDPMLATGGTLAESIKFIFERGAESVTCICLIAAPEGVERLKEIHGGDDRVHIVLAAMDQKLNEKSYIIPGLGDAGDRLYGVTPPIA
ncbi:uracil phosphoribosyltransferase [Glutamicibacter nicotianae]|uniref:uracil phosphoribosyltransferase n=1 Tax=Glutamicibacter nicotianae TaxID=37929 RepID=UPI00195E52C4|nr:uracil phosphoribosyltransferase [Glutamicibacter nicotianae]MBM7767290.1 uracil phosphoribosyltransferase [Glutamicibacter nicotianae]